MYFNSIPKEKFTSLLSFKKNFSFSNEELILVNNLFNFSPGKFLQFYFKENSLMNDYILFINNFITINKSTQNLSKNTICELDLKLLFLNNFINVTWMHFENWGISGTWLMSIIHIFQMKFQHFVFSCQHAHLNSIHISIGFFKFVFIACFFKVYWVLGILINIRPF